MAAFAEAGRLPFDMAEAEQELVGGYHTEYSGMKLMMYLVGEYIHMFIASFLIVILFFGGWHLWGLTGSGQLVTWPIAILRVVVLMAKVLGMVLFYMIARWSWPRFRFDQVMAICWKGLLPLGIVNLVVVAVWVEYGNRLAAMIGLPLLAAMAACGWCVLVVSWLVAIVAAPGSCDNRPRFAPFATGRPIEVEE